MTDISIMYEDTTAKVITSDGETETVNILAGVLQGDTLAPYLVVIVIDYVMRKALLGRKEKTEEYHLSLLQTRTSQMILHYSEGIKDAQEILTRVEKSTKRIVLIMNTGETKYMRYNTNQQF